MKFFILCAAFLSMFIPVSMAADRPAIEKLSITRADGERIELNVEIAATPETRTIGLMFRKSMPEDLGMLFIFNQEEVRAFWMKNTFIPLDMIFIRRDGTIVHIAENAVPHDETPVFSIRPAFAVLEINGGMASKLGLQPGDIINHHRLNNGLAERVPIH